VIPGSLFRSFCKNVILRQLARRVFSGPHFRNMLIQKEFPGLTLLARADDSGRSVIF
jgi:hypothetical protein